MTDVLTQPARRRDAFNAATSRGVGLVAEFRRPEASNDLQVPDIKATFRSDFKKAFNKRADDGRRGKGAGYLLKYSYYDTKPDSWGAPVPTSRPWDSLVTQGEHYVQIPSEEERALRMAIREDMMDNIPTNVHYIALGPGEVSAFNKKDSQVFKALQSKGHEIIGASVVDIHSRYAKETALTIYDTFGVGVKAYGRDFFAHSLSDLTIEPEATPLICVFGGTLQNMPETATKTSDEEMVKFYSTMTKGLPEAHLLMTVDTTPEDIDPALAVSAYEYSFEIELFVMNFMARAKEEGIILDKDYDILKHWKMPDPEWKDKSVNIDIVAKRDHVLPTVDGDYEIKAGDRVSVSKSRKGPIQDHIDMLNQAGFKTVQVYPQNSAKAATGQARFIVHARP